MPTDDPGNSYDAFAAGYARDNEQNAWNAHYERPATLRLIGAARGRRVLDAGCGAGALSEALVERGAEVVGVDDSAALLEIATQRLAGRPARFERHDLRRPLPFVEAEFDLVAASLVMHYLEDWGPTLAEFRRVLRPGGRLVISTHHPFMDHLLAAGEDYFATYEIREQWEREGRTVEMRFWHRPLRAMTAALDAAGFRIEAVEEPDPEPIVRERFPDAWDSLSREPRFIFFVATPAEPR